MNAKLLPRDLDACFEDCGGVHEAEGGAVTNIKDCGYCHCKCLLLNLNEPDVCITFCVHTTRVSVNSDSDILQNQNFRNWSRR